MSYNRQNFQTGAILYASQLNAMDAQIQESQAACDRLAGEVERLDSEKLSGRSTFISDGVTLTLNKYMNTTTLAENAGGSGGSCGYVDFTFTGAAPSTVIFTGRCGDSLNYRALAFYDSENNLLGAVGERTATAYTNQQVSVPPGARRVIVNNIFGGVGNLAFSYESNEFQLAISKAAVAVTSPWNGKKIVLLGTSVGFGQYAAKSYFDVAAELLGFEKVNTSVPGMCIHTQNGGLPTDRSYASSLSLSEYEALGASVPSSPSDSHYFCAWDRIFTSQTADADYYLFAVTPNNINWDLTDWNAFDKTNWRYTDGSSFSAHRDTFLGALLFLMDKLYALNPNARMALVIDCSFNRADGLAAFERLKSQWLIPVIDLWAGINYTPPYHLKTWAADDNPHPSTLAHQCMGRMLAGELLRLA